ncbi:MAG: class I SAM-dependent methyltransferase, partial [Acidimicrobiales bacterium]
MTVRDAYTATGAAWRDGPELVYQRLADALVATSPVDLAGRLVADVGAGTGAASRAIVRAGGRPVALDLAAGMLRVDQSSRPPAAVADVRRLPLASGSCAALVAAFSFNHVPDPDVALREAARVVGPGGTVLASTYASDDTHRVKGAVDQAAAEAGWARDPWIDELRGHAIPLLATLEGARSALASAGLGAVVRRVEVAYPDLHARALVAWRLGMAQVAPFVATLPAPARAQLEARALE